MAREEATSAAIELLDEDGKRIRSAIAKLRSPAGLDIEFDGERSRLFRFGSRTFVVAFDRTFFGTGGDFEHLRGRRSLVAVVGQANPTQEDKFEPHRLIVLDLRSSASPRVEIRRPDGSVRHSGPARIEKGHLVASISIAVPRTPLAGTIEGSVNVNGEVRLARASLSIKTAPQAPERERVSG